MTITGRGSSRTERIQQPRTAASCSSRRLCGTTRFLLVGGLSLSVCTAFAIAATPGAAQTAFPSPLDGPGRPRLEKSQVKAVTNAAELQTTGRTQKALKKLSKAGTGPAQQLLGLQIAYAADSVHALQSLQELVEEAPEYAAAWATLFVAAQGVAEQKVAFEAAGHVIELWPGSRWAQQASEMRRRLVDELVTAAEHSMETRPPEQALADIELALEVDPTNAELLLRRSECLIRLDRLDDAESILTRLANDPRALMMTGHIAELEGDLIAAMEHYQAAPAETPGRDEALRRAKTRWRLSVLPSYVQSALASDRVTRAELAVLLVNLVPEVRAMGSGSVPLLTDVLDLPSQRDIVTAARLELLSVDRVEHRFDPDRTASVAEIRDAIERLTGLVGAPTPVWCGVSNVVSSCMELTAPVHGKDVTDVVLSLVHGESR